MHSHKTHFPAAGKTKAKPSQEDIAREAYRRYVEGGRQEGRDLDYWLEAEKALGGGVITETLPPVEFVEGKAQPKGGPAFDRPRKNAANREEIRQFTSPLPHAPRQSQRRQEQSV